MLMQLVLRARSRYVTTLYMDCYYTFPKGTLFSHDARRFLQLIRSTRLRTLQTSRLTHDSELTFFNLLAS